MKLRIELPAAVKVCNAAVEQMMKARVKKSRVMDRMKKMAEETRKEMEVVEAMKKQLRLRVRIRSFGVIIFLLLLLMCFIFCFGCFAARVTFSARHE